jgi:hypothetical protein
MTRYISFPVIFIVILFVVAQVLSQPLSPGPVAAVTAETALSGQWTYPSFYNRAAPVTEDSVTAPQRTLALIFAEAVFTFESLSATTLKDAFDWQGGGLDLHGTVRRANKGPKRRWRSLAPGGRSQAPPDGNATIVGNSRTSGPMA